MTPSDRRYAESHEWAKQVGDVIVVGITDHAQDALGDITFIEFPALGTTVEKGKECAVIESVKAASDICAPVSGEIAEKNAALETAPEKVNESAYEEGWILKIKGSPTGEYDSLMSAEEYGQFLETSE